MWSHLQSFPRVLLSSALCSCGYWFPSFFLAAWAHTMKAFMGLLMWGFLFPFGPVLDGIATTDQSYPFSTLDTASLIDGENCAAVPSGPTTRADGSTRLGRMARSSREHSLEASSESLPGVLGLLPSEREWWSSKLSGLLMLLIICDDVR